MIGSFLCGQYQYWFGIFIFEIGRGPIDTVHSCGWKQLAVEKWHKTNHPRTLGPADHDTLAPHLSASGTSYQMWELQVALQRRNCQNQPLIISARKWQDTGILAKFVRICGFFKHPLWSRPNATAEEVTLTCDYYANHWHQVISHQERMGWNVNRDHSAEHYLPHWILRRSSMLTGLQSGHQSIKPV